MSESDAIDDLIGKVLTLEATATEREQLDHWLQQSNANARYFEDLKIIFEKAAASRVKMKFDEDEAWRKVKSKIERQRRQIFFPSMIVRVAAGIAIVATIGYFFYESSKPTGSSFAIATLHQTRQDTLPDGSVAFVNKNSHLNYEFNATEKTRKIKLDGEAYFEVRHDETRPLLIEANETLIQDIGTTFNVDAYPNSDSIVVTVESGKVHFYTLNDSGVDLNEGEAGIYIKSTKKFSKSAVANFNDIAYKTKVFSFRDTDLKTAVEMINEIYESKLILGNTAIGNCRLTVNFNNNPEEEMAEIIAETLGLTVEKKEGNFILNGSGCAK